MGNPPQISAAMPKVFWAHKPLPPDTRSAVRDPLTYLPRSKILQYRKKQVVYGKDEPSRFLYLVMYGMVNVSRLAGRRRLLMDIYGSQEFFGESALLGPRLHETAIAIEDTGLMVWSAPEIENIAATQPLLCISLGQVLVRKSLAFVDRIAGFAFDQSDRRIARALLYFGQRFGHVTEDGSIEMFPITHDLLAQYTGTSRDVVSQCVSEFRRQGHLDYSRKSILLSVNKLQMWLK
jgi:CRP-like cAMP-binding protein